MPAWSSRGTGCSCARVEETGGVDRAGPVQLRHDGAVDRIARRIAALLRSEYELVHVVEKGPVP
jgi:hypothetical protein